MTTIATDLLQRHIETLVDDAARWETLIADDILWELAYAPSLGHPARLSGRDAEERRDFARQLRMGAARKDLQLAESGRHERITHGGSVPLRVSRKWLGRKDSNLRIRDPKSRALPLGHAPSSSLLAEF